MTRFLKKVEAMAFSRDKWVSKVRNALQGALREYAKHKYGELVDFDFSWEPEVKRLIKDVEKLFDTKLVVVKFADIDKAFSEAFTEASLSNSKISYARNQFESNYLANDPEKIKAFLRLASKAHAKFEAKKLLIEMLKKFSPPLAKRLKL